MVISKEEHGYFYFLIIRYVYKNKIYMIKTSFDNHRLPNCISPSIYFDFRVYSLATRQRYYHARVHQVFSMYDEYHLQKMFNYTFVYFFWCLKKHVHTVMNSPAKAQLYRNFIPFSIDMNDVRAYLDMIECVIKNKESICHSIHHYYLKNYGM